MSEPLPPYAFVPGRFPHPASYPQGHRFGVPAQQPAAPDPQRWAECAPYVHGIDLFNHGYYWEAHEVWEGLWNACGRRGALADFFKALIQIAVAGVKVREEIPEGVRKHAARAAQLFRQVVAERGESQVMGLALEQLAGWAEDVAQHPPQTKLPAPAPVEVVFCFVLSPRP